MSVYRIDPLVDPRWAAFVERAPQSSVFHTTGWLEALRRTYGFRPVAYTTSLPAEELTNGIVMSSVRSWLTGSRLVSGAFADHCDPLFAMEADLHTSIDALLEDARGSALKYVELRTTAEDIGGGRVFAHGQYCHHVLDLSPSIEALFAGCHKNSTQRRIQRARREPLQVDSGRSPALLNAFYALFVTTRRRHHLPPPPLAWFQNLMACLGDAAVIHVALKDARPIGAIIVLRHRDVVVYKYGASDAAMHGLAPMPFLMWHAIEEGKRSGMRRLDFGRSNLDQPGLITFKDHFGAARTTMTYFRNTPPPRTSSASFTRRVAHALIRKMPDRALQAVGTVLYRHIA